MRMPPHVGSHWTEPLEPRGERPPIRLRWYLAALLATLVLSHIWPWGFAS